MARTFDIDECADFLKVDRNTALKLAQRGDLPGARIGRAWVFLEDDIVEYLRVRVRQQMVERQNDNVVDEALRASIEKTPPTPSPLLMKMQNRERGRRKIPPALPPLPEHVSESARA
ncbi:helix-turn-helix domain-containing protein [Paraburkholderia sp.]|uniref:helix-turn-helix domain-containing protein n=1 Tax=Paraburkholderia sp. TaxID=1926495 RepID=UPI0039E3193D